MSEIELLKLVLKATEAGKMEWKQVKPDHYEADIDRYLYIIEYETPYILDGKESYVSLIRIVVAGALITCADGTQLAEIVQQILAAAFIDWKDTVRFMEEARIEAAEINRNNKWQLGCANPHVKG